MKEDYLPTLKLGDKRLTERCKKLLDQFTDIPACSIPQACMAQKDIKAAYRFFSHPKVSSEAILQAHYAQTVARMKQEKEGPLLAHQDTTDLDFTTKPRTRNLGYLEGKQLYGLRVHSCLVTNISGTPLGLLDQYCWVREADEYGKSEDRWRKPIEEKESIRWINTLNKVQEHVTDIPMVVIGDREADIYELFTAPRHKNIDILVRATHNRKLATEVPKLKEVMEKETPVASISLEVPRGRERTARSAQLSVSYRAVEIQGPHRGKGNTVRLFCVLAQETNPPEGERPIAWLLLTTYPLLNEQDAVTSLQWYTKRWLIERFHYTLKSGCQIEELQLEERVRIERALAVYSIVAWRILWMTYQAREQPTSLCTEILKEDEWKVLSMYSNHTHHPPKEPPSVKAAVLMIAKLGGFMGRKGDGDPGVKVIWRGLQTFSKIYETWCFFNEPTKLMGNG